MSYTAVEMAALNFVEVAYNKAPENEVRDAMRKLMYELMKAGLLKLPLSPK